MLAELQKTVEALKKDHEALVKKERIIDTALNASESEIREFQSHKQQELNKLDTVVALKMHQVHNCACFLPLLSKFTCGRSSVWSMESCRPTFQTSSCLPAPACRSSTTASASSKRRSCL